jgi:penicillin-binding protein 1C
LYAFPRHAPHHSAALLRNSDADLVQSTLDGRLQRQLESLAAKEGAAFEEGVTMAAVVLDNADGSVRAWLGSHDLYNEKASGYIDMVSAVRSPGSTLKPFIYGLAFDSNQLHPQTLVRDLPRSFGSYSPVNFDGSYRGDVTIVEALQQSLNVPAVAVLERIRPGRLADAFRKAGVELRIAGNRPSLPMALGGVGMTLQELAGLYRNLAVSSDRRLRDTTAKHGMLNTRSAGWITKILSENSLPEGLVSTGRQVAWKTGTSYGYRDAWTLGYTRDVTLGVWIGRPDGHPRQGSRELTQGRRAAAPLFFSILSLLPESAGFRLARAWDEPPPALVRFEQTGSLIAEPLELRLLSGGERLRTGAACGRSFLDLAATHGEKPYQWFINGAPAGRSQSARHRIAVDEPGNMDLQVMDGRMRTASLSVWIDRPRCL